MEINGIIEENPKIEPNYRTIVYYIGQEEKGAILQYPGNRVILVLSEMLSTKIDEAMWEPCYLVLHVS